MDLGLDGRVALVSGSWRGTGAGIARVLAAEGATVLVHGMEPGQADDVATGITAAGGRAHVVVGDIRTDAGAEAVVAEVTGAGAGPVDVLVANYGTAEGPGWFDATPADWVASYETNVLSAVRLVNAFVPGMRERGWGRVVAVGTVGSVRPGTRPPQYYAAKGALVNLVVGLSRELSGSGVTVNVVSPGVIATAEVKARFLRLAAERGWGDDWDEVSRRVATEVSPNPTGRIPEPEDVGDLVAFVASDRAWHVNGANLRVDGGSTGTVS